MATKWDMPKLELKPPLRVSPFIKFCRWSLLAVGIAYGMRRHHTLSKKETAHRIQLRQKKIIWDEEQKLIKSKANREEMLYLAKETKNPIPKNFDQMYPQ